MGTGKGHSIRPPLQWISAFMDSNRRELLRVRACYLKGETAAANQKSGATRWLIEGCGVGRGVWKIREVSSFRAEGTNPSPNSKQLSLEEFTILFPRPVRSINSRRAQAGHDLLWESPPTK